jgi:5-formaminoimidazole-4-carboxamide-1-beta-D-ribofuranosyl 5'-monophosphate synthetase
MCPDAKAKDGRGYFKARQLEDPSVDKKEEKSIRQIRIRHSDLNTGHQDPFLR